MTRSNYKHLASQVTQPTDFVRWLLPLHFGGAYAYLSNSITIGALVVAAFALAYSIQEK